MCISHSAFVYNASRRRSNCGVKAVQWRPVLHVDAFRVTLDTESNKGNFGEGIGLTPIGMPVKDITFDN